MAFQNSDFVAVGELAFKVHGQCKSSVIGWRELSREVDSMLIVLDEIAAYWNEADASGHPISNDHRLRLQNQAEACQKVLADLLAYLEKIKTYRRAGDAAWRSRQKLVAKDVGPTRNRLILRTTLLSTLSVTITSGTAANEQARLLQALNIIHRDHEAGNRPTPAFAQATTADLDANADNVWGDIFLELQTEGVKAETVNNHYEFVRNWIDRVIHEDGDDAPEEAVSPGSPSWSHSLKSANSFKSAGAVESPISPMSKGGWSPEVPPLTISRSKSTQHDIPLARQDSSSSHQSKDETWRPMDCPNPEYVRKLLTKALCLEGSLSSNRNRIVRIAMRAFYQLDWSDRGFLYHHTIDEATRDAAISAGINLTDKERSHLISAADKNNNGRVSRDQFIGFVESLTQHTRGRREEELDLAIESNIKRGRARHKNKITDLSRKTLSWNWTEAVSSPGGREKPQFTFPGRLGEWIQRKDRPVASEDSFTIMCSLASLCFIPLLDRMLSRWSTHLTREQFNEYRVPIDNVMLAVSKFTKIHNYSVSPDTISDFDVLYESGSVAHPVLSSNINLDLFQRLNELKEKCFGLILSSYGFIDAMGLDHYLNQPPPLSEWLNLRMDERALRIMDASNACFGNDDNFNDDVVKECKSWLRTGSYQIFSDSVLNGVESATKLRSQQLAQEEARRATEQNEKDVAQAVGRTKITFDLTGAFKLPKLDVLGRRMPNPSAEVEWEEDNGGSSKFSNLASVSATKARSDEVYKTCNPEWNCQLQGYVNPKTTVKITVKSDRDDSKEKAIGVATFRVSDHADLGKLTSQECEVQLHKDSEDGEALPSRLTFTITPHPRPQKVLQPLPRTSTSLPDLMEAINILPLASGWTRCTTPDARTYFKCGAHECTVAVPLPAPPDFDKIAFQLAERTALEETSWIAAKKPGVKIPSLPKGWERKRAPNGRVFFVDFNEKKTGWIDPRVPSYARFVEARERMKESGLSLEGMSAGGMGGRGREEEKDEVLKGLKAASSRLQQWV